MKIRQRTFSTTDPGETARERENRAVARRAAAEGITLLKNDHHLLPLKQGKKLALYGTGASRTVKGGTGSGDVNERETVSILQGLRDSGIEVTTRRWMEDYDRIFDQARQEWKESLLQKAGDQDLVNFFLFYSEHPFVRPEGRPVSEKDVEESGTDTAAYVISRIAGEGADRDPGKGDYRLTDHETEDLRFLCARYEHVILIVNSGAQIDLSLLRELDRIESVLYLVQAGMEGGNALADVLTGKVNPSGKLTDTWAWNYEDYPASASFLQNREGPGKDFYREGILVGYRYFDRFGIEPQFPFGFGLSYTEFQWEPAGTAADEKTQTISVSVRVTNTGDRYPGREVIQIYAACPQNGRKKELRRLCGFQKTGLLSPGDSETVTVSFPVRALTSYDPEQGAWVADQGLYVLYAGNSSRNLTPAAGLTVERDCVAERVSPVFRDAEAPEEISWPEDRLTENPSLQQSRLEENGLPVLPLSVSEQKREQKQVPGMEQALNLARNLSPEEVAHMVTGEVSRGQGSSAALGSAGVIVPGSAGETSSFLEEKYGIPGAVLADGPAGLRLSRTYQTSRTTGRLIPEDPFAAFEGGYFSRQREREEGETHYQYCTSFPVGTLLAQTWDVCMAEEVGRSVGREMKELGVTLWLAPGMNLHRDPLCGRNFEYFSEDPVVSGRMAAGITRGVQSLGGIGVTLKHFACNNRENHRMSLDSVLSERALREIYLKGFEIAVKTCQPMAIMTSYNLVNGIHSANHAGLLTQIAREEWGYTGIFMTDWTTTSPQGGSISWKCIEAGNDLIMPGTEEDLKELTQALENGTLDRKAADLCAARLISLIWKSDVYEDVPIRLGEDSSADAPEQEAGRD